MNSRLRYCLILVLFARSARASELWLVTNVATVNDGEAVWSSVVVGDVFPISDQAPGPTHIADRGPSGSQIVEMASGRDGALTSRGPLRGTGMHVFGAERGPVELESGDSVLQSAKCFVEVQPSDALDSSYSIPIGHALEIVPLTNPCHWETGQSVDVRVLLEGHPWAKIPLSLGHEGCETPCERAIGVTNSDGVATISLDKSGHGFVSAKLEREVGGIGKQRKELLTAMLSFHARGSSDVGPMVLAIRAIHGGLDAAAVLGYRMGQRAIEELGVAPGSGELEVTVWTPQASIGIIDGVQAATKTSAGRGNLRVEPAPGMGDVQAIFTRRTTQQRIVCRLQPNLSDVEKAMSGGYQSALEIIVRPDEDLFIVEKVGGDAVPKAKPPELNLAVTAIVH